MQSFGKKTIIVVALAILLSTFSLAQSSTSEVIDRIVATVNGHIILQSDWNEALSYEAVLSGRTAGQFSDEDRRAILNRLIDQELLGEQMKSNFFQHASETEAAARVADARKQYPDGATDQGWQSVLDRFGLTQKDLTAHVQQEIDLMRLVDAHLRPTVQIDSKSIEDYYRDTFVPQLKASGAAEVPLPDVSGKIRELLTEEKVSELMVSWLQQLRLEGKVSMPGASGEGVATR
jgi:peptidyl-prolyl cis-trans isomerase SurA